MKRSLRKPAQNPPPGDHQCNHPLAVVIDPTDSELRALEMMLAECPNCSRWTPGDGPIMAVLLSRAQVPREKDIG